MEIDQVMSSHDGAILFVVRDATVVVNYWDRRRALANLGLAG